MSKEEQEGKYKYTIPNVIPMNTIHENSIHREPIKEINYIPYSTPRNPNYNDWLRIYYKDLVCMYEIMVDNLSEKFSNKFKDFFEDFCSFIYDNSSKHIREY